MNNLKNRGFFEKKQKIAKSFPFSSMHSNACGNMWDAPSGNTCVQLPVFTFHAPPSPENLFDCVKTSDVVSPRTNEEKVPLPHCAANLPDLNPASSPLLVEAQRPRCPCAPRAQGRRASGPA